MEHRIEPWESIYGEILREVRVSTAMNFEDSRRMDLTKPVDYYKANYDRVFK
jgi:hypothetical protein